MGGTGNNKTAGSWQNGVYLDRFKNVKFDCKEDFDLPLAF